LAKNDKNNFILSPQDIKQETNIKELNDLVVIFENTIPYEEHIENIIKVGNGFVDYVKKEIEEDPLFKDMNETRKEILEKFVWDFSKIEQIPTQTLIIKKIDEELNRVLKYADIKISSLEKNMSSLLTICPRNKDNGLYDSRVLIDLKFGSNAKTVGEVTLYPIEKDKKRCFFGVLNKDNTLVCVGTSELGGLWNSVPCNRWDSPEYTRFLKEGLNLFILNEEEKLHNTSFCSKKTFDIDIKFKEIERPDLEVRL